MNNLKNALRSALLSDLGVRGAIEDDTELFAEGLIDSLGVMGLVSFVEDRVGRAVPPDAITLDNFGTIERIARFTLELASRASDT